MHPQHNGHDCHHWHAAGRRRRHFGHGFAAFEEAFDDKIRRRFDGDDLRLLILHLIEAEPRHGYDIIKAVEALSDGAYSPSPGVVYPALTYLEEAGYAEGSTEANRKSYAITDEGRAHLDAHREELDAIIARLDHIGRRRRDARERFERKVVRIRRHLGEDVAEDVDVDIPDVIPEVNAARRALKQAIRGAIGEGEQAQRRLAKLLEKTAAEIRGGEEIDLG